MKAGSWMKSIITGKPLYAAKAGLTIELTNNLFGYDTQDIVEIVVKKTISDKIFVKTSYKKTAVLLKKRLFLNCCKSVD